MKPIGQAIKERLQKAIRAIESRAAHPKEIRSREDTYPFVLLVIAVILGWGVVKTRDLDGALVLVKWFLICLFIAVISVYGTLYIARLLWDRKHGSKTTPYHIQTKPKRERTAVPTAEKRDRREETGPRLLFPEGTCRAPLPGGYAEAYDAALGMALSPSDTDGVPLYTEDPTVIRYRADLFRELCENRALADVLRRFADSYPVSLSDRSFRESLGDMKARQEAVKTLAKDLGPLVPRSDAMKTLKRFLSDRSGEIERAEAAFAELPEDLFRVQSVTLAVNLDSGGYAHEAGIVALHTEPFDDRDATPLLRPDPERYDLTLDFNRELMGCVDRMLAESFRRLRIRLEDLREAELPDGMTDDIRFAAAFTDFLRSLDGVEVRFGSADTHDSSADLAAFFWQRSLGYEAKWHADGSGITARALQPFGCGVYIRN
ncbi:MAG: hypothetical protein K6A33_00015 [Clostridiales bacterium]|nr:hypothetical protein [Clostridiales bacterium]